jgi:hypothetical protein
VLGLPLFPGGAVHAVWALLIAALAWLMERAPEGDDGPALSAMLTPASSSAPRSPTCCCCSWWPGGRPARAAGPLGDRQRLGLCAVDGGVLHRLDLLRQRRPRGLGRRVVPADLPGADAGHAAGLDGAAQDDPHRAHLPHHLDRRLHGQPLRQEPAAGRAGDADHGGGHRALHRAAAEGHRQRLRGADHAAGRQPLAAAAGAWWQDGTLYVALALAGFTMVFGTRHLDSTERHEGMVAAIAFESVVKLLAFLAVGVFVTWGLFGGPGDLFARALAVPELAALLRCRRQGKPFAYAQWFALTLLSMLSVIFLPRQFQVMVVENVDERHLKRAAWAFPAYLLADQPVRAADRAGRAAVLRARQRQRRHLRAVAAAGRRAARGLALAGLRRRAVGGHRHGHRRGHRRVDHGLQRPGDAAAAAPARVSARRRPHRRCCWASAAPPSWPCCCWATCTSTWPARPMRWSASA